MELVYTFNDLDTVAQKLIKNVDSKILLINGEMGVGKTTLIKALVKALGSTDDVSSPTFSIVNEYLSDSGIVYHFDLYRVNDIDEAFNIGVEDYLYSNNWCIIEWPDIIEPILPENTTKIELFLNEDMTRTLKM